MVICETHILLQIRKFASTFGVELANKGHYKARVGSIRLKLQDLQETNSEAIELRTKDGYKVIDRVLHHQDLPFMHKAIQIKVISRHHNNPLVGHFRIDKTQELVTWKYFWPTLWHNIEAYVKSCDVYSASKPMRQ